MKSATQPLLQRLRMGPLVTDGALGTLLSARGYDREPAPIYNLKVPEVIEEIHRAYIEAGAELIETNTFAANRYRLEAHHYDHLVAEVNRKAVEIARRAAADAPHPVYIAGAVGPIGHMLAPIGRITPDEARAAFREQIEALVEAGVDALMLETFVDLRELDEAISAAQEVGRGRPIIAQKTFSEDGAVLAGSFPLEVVQHLRGRGVDVVGANCTVGPQRMYGLIRKMYEGEGILLSAQPTAGIPHLSGGKQRYNATPEYLADYARQLVEAGVTLIGACCGSTPEHIRAIADTVRGMEVGSRATQIAAEAAPQATEPTGPSHVEVVPRSAPPKPTADGETSDFEYLIRRGTFVTTCELDIPRGLDMTAVLDGARFLRRNGFTAANISDGARARLRMTSAAISVSIEREIGIETVTHMTCRDRNLLGLQAELLGAHHLGLRNLLAVTGDPAQIGDYPHATSVFDIDAINLIRAMAEMNRGHDLVKNPIGRPTRFFIACAANPVSDDLDREIERLEQKVDAGAHCIFTQPVYELAALETFIRRIESFKVPVILGVLPLRGAKHAEFLHHEVPGIDIPDELRERFRHAAPKGGAALGVKLCAEFLRDAKPMVQGAYLMPPFQKYEMAVDILAAV